MAIFKKAEKQSIVPEEPETEEELNHIKKLSESDVKPEKDNEDQKENKEQYREVPVCLSQTQINNLVIENNMMLKQIMLQLNE